MSKFGELMYHVFRVVNRCFKSHHESFVVFSSLFGAYRVFQVDSMEMDKKMETGAKMDKK